MKRPPILLGISAIFVFALVLPVLGQVEVERAPVKWEHVAVSDGEVLYAELCAVCHGADATGNGPAAAALAAPVPDLTQLALAYDGVFPREEVEKAISREKGVLAHGTLEMPIWGKVLEDVRPDFKPSRREAFANWRISNLTTYIETLQVDSH